MLALDIYAEKMQALLDKLVWKIRIIHLSQETNMIYQIKTLELLVMRQ